MATNTMNVESAASAIARGAGRMARETRTGTGTHNLVRFLGWFSVGLGVSEILAPGLISRIAGSRNHKNLVRSFGLRELGAGVGILSQRRPAKWLWARVAGDTMDIASIIGGSTSRRRGATIGALASVAGVTALDIYCAQHCTRQEKISPDAERAESSLLIGRSPEECYRFWRDVENFPRFVPEILSVRKTGERSSHWTAALPGNTGELEWDAEITEDAPNERISWRCTPRAGLTMNGTVDFQAAPGKRGTIVRLQMEYDHAGRTFAAPFSKLLGKHPKQTAYKALRRMKQLLEVGEILTTEGQPAGRRGSVTWLDRIAS